MINYNVAKALLNFLTSFLFGYERNIIVFINLNFFKTINQTHTTKIIVS